MNNKNYEIVYQEGDEVCFKTYFPDSKYQPCGGGGGLFGFNLTGGLDKAEKIKGEIILIHDDRYHVLVGKAVYICKNSVLKPVSKPGGILFFEVKEKEDPFRKMFIGEPKPNPVRKFIEKIRSSDYCPIFIIWFWGFAVYSFVYWLIYICVDRG